MSVKRLFEKVEMKQEHVRGFVCQSRLFKFASLRSDLNSKHGKKMNNTTFPKQRYLQKFQALKMGKTCQKDVKTTSEVIFISDVLFTNINHYQSSKILRVTFLVTPETLPSLIFKTLLSETFRFRTLFIFQTNAQTFCTFENAKTNKYLPRYFEKDPLTVHTRLYDEATKYKLWTG